MYAKCFYTDVLTWMMKSHAMDDSEIYDDDDDDDDVLTDRPLQSFAGC